MRRPGVARATGSQVLRFRCGVQRVGHVERLRCRLVPRAVRGREVVDPVLSEHLGLVALGEEVGGEEKSPSRRPVFRAMRQPPNQATKKVAREDRARPMTLMVACVSLMLLSRIILSRINAVTMPGQSK